MGWRVVAGGLADSGQDRLKDAGTAPAALLDGNGNGNVVLVR